MNHKHLAHAQSNLRRKQKTLSRKIEAAKLQLNEFKAASPDKCFRLRDFFGSNIKKNMKHVALCHERIANARNDWQHKLFHTLVDESQAIIVDDLAVKNMIKNRKLSKVISDAGWS